jgi:hypothetical protein
LNILWHSYGPWANTSYGTQTALAALTDASYADAMTRIAQLAPALRGWGDPHRGWQSDGGRVVVRYR